MFVKNWMTKDPITINIDANIVDAQETARENNIRHLPVMDGGKLVGIVSRGDLRDVSPSDATTLSVHELNYLFLKMTVKEIMTRDPFTVTPDTTIEETAKRMREHRVECMLVVDPETDALVGIITESDIFDVFLEAVGIQEKGCRLMVDVHHRPGQLLELAKVIKKHELNMLSFVALHAADPEKRTMLIRLETDNADALVAELQEMGYGVSVQYDQV
jgi:acetoin utilization protein AcuB